MSWSLIEETGQLATTLQDGREMTVNWDAGDLSLYLAVIVPAQGSMGQQTPQRVYTAPLSLLAALVLVPKDFHEYLTGLHAQGRDTAQSAALQLLHDVVENMPKPFPDPSKALDALHKSAKQAGHVERLALDLAAADAFTDMGTPV